MYAIVEIAGQQFKVEAGQEIFVHRLQAEEGANLSFDEVLLVAEGDSINVGQPTVSGTSVNATVLEHVKGDKVLVFKKKRRKGYRKKNGHRQSFTKIQIDSIGAAVASSGLEAAVAAPEVPAVGMDNLKLIEGIGPKIESMLKENGVNTLADLAAATEERLKEILATGSAIMASKNPSTWARQAQMAVDGKMDELKAWQDELDGGVEK